MPTPASSVSPPIRALLAYSEFNLPDAEGRPCKGMRVREVRATAAGPTAKPRSHDTSRIAWAKLMARVGEVPVACPNCGGDIRLIAFITEPGPIRTVLTHLGEPLEHPPITPARGPPTDRGGLGRAHDDREAIEASPDELPVIDIRSR